MKVGDTIYGYHVNNNRASRDYPELPYYWAPYEITGETRQSWICGDIKIDKKTMVERQYNYSPIQFVSTLEEVIRKDFIDNRWRLARKIEECKDYDILKKIDELLTKGGL